MKNITLAALLVFLCIAGTNCALWQKSTPAAERIEPSWRLALQAQTLKSSSFCNAVDKAASIGIHYIEAFPGQRIGGEIEGKLNHNIDQETRNQILNYCKDRNVKIIHYGIVQVDKPDEWRKVFEFVQAMGIETIISDVPGKKLNLIEKLCEEFAVNLAIYNRKKPATYDTPAKMISAVQWRSKLLGVCADTGSWLRSGVNPLDGLSSVGDRLRSVYLKDVHERGAIGYDVPFDSGYGQVFEILATLHRQNFRGVITIDYELKDGRTFAEVETSADRFRAMTSAIQSSDFNQLMNFDGYRNYLEAQARSENKNVWKRLETKLIAALKASETNFRAKQYACDLLSQLGSVSSIPAIADLLDDEELAFAACTALQQMQMAEAGTALSQKLLVVDDAFKPGILSALSTRVEQASISAIKEFVPYKAVLIEGMAIRALGRIGGVDAAEIIQKASTKFENKLARDETLLLIAEGLADEDAIIIYNKMIGKTHPMLLVRTWSGLIKTDKENAVEMLLDLLNHNSSELRRTAVGMIPEIAGSEFTETLAAQLDGLSTETQVLVLGALAERNDPVALPEIIDHINDPDLAVALAAMDAVSELGDAKAASPMALLAAQSGERGITAMEALCRIHDSEVADTLIELLTGDETAKVKTTAINALETRRDITAVLAILSMTESEYSRVRKAAYSALGTLASGDEFPVLLEKIKSIYSRSERRVVAKAAYSIAGRLTEDVKENEEKAVYPVRRFEHAENQLLSAFNSGNEKSLPELLSVAPNLQSPKILEFIRWELDSENADIQKNAIKALGEWQTTDPLPDLLQIVRTESNLVNQTLALRGLLNQVSLPTTRTFTNSIEILSEVYGLARQPDEKRSILGVLHKFPCVESLAMARICMEDDAIAEEAKLAFKRVRKRVAVNSLVVTASENKDNAKLAFDLKGRTGWSTEKAMTPGNWIQLDFGLVDTVKRITLFAANRNTYPRASEIYSSRNGRNWSKCLLSGKAQWATTHLKFPQPVEARYFRIVQTGFNQKNKWTVNEIAIESAMHGPGMLIQPDVAWNFDTYAEPNDYASWKFMDNKQNTIWDTGREMESGDWVAVDMQTSYTVSGFTLAANGHTNDYPRGYGIYVSDDGRSWGTAIYTGQGWGHPTYIELDEPVKTQHFKILQTESTKTGYDQKYWWTISELFVHADFDKSEKQSADKKYGRSMIKASAIKTPKNKNMRGREFSGNPAAAFDGDTFSSWTSGQPMEAGDWFAFDLGQEKSIKRIVIDSSEQPEDFPREFSIYASTDGENWGEKVYEGKGTPSKTIITFEDVINARHFKIEQTGSLQSEDETWWWSIGEIYFETGW